MPRKKSVEDEVLMTNAAVAQRLGVSVSSIKRMRRDGSLPTIHVRGAARIPKSAIDAILRGE